MYMIPLFCSIWSDMQSIVTLGDAFLFSSAATFTCCCSKTMSVSEISIYSFSGSISCKRMFIIVTCKLYASIKFIIELILFTCAIKSKLDANSSVSLLDMTVFKHVEFFPCAPFLTLTAFGVEVHFYKPYISLL